MESIPKLAADGSNWGSYRDSMVFMLGVLDLDDHLTDADVPKSGAEVETVDEAEAAFRWERDDASVKQYIAASIPNNVFILVKGGTTAKDVWHNLNTQFESQSRATRGKLKRRLCMEQCRDADDVRTHFDKMASLREQLATAGGSISDNEYAHILLDSLPEAYDTTVTAMNSVAVVCQKDIFPEAVTNLITNEYDRKKSRGD
jgi:hypothetical protein